MKVVAIVWIAVTATCIIRQTLANDVYNLPEFSELLSHKQLIDILYHYQDLPGYPTYLYDGKKAAYGFAMTKNKNKPRVIARQYSIQQLLDLNRYDSDDCSDIKFNQRKSMCDTVGNRNWIYRGGERYRSMHLFDYCIKIMDEVGEFCSKRDEEQMLKEISVEDKAKIITFQESVGNAYGGCGDRVKSVLDKMMVAEKSKLLATCSMFVQKLSKAYKKLRVITAFFRKEESWLLRYQLCYVAIAMGNNIYPGDTYWGGQCNVGNCNRVRYTVSVERLLGLE